MKELERLQNRAVTIVTGFPKLYTVRSTLLEDLMDMHACVSKHKAGMMYRIVQGLAPSYLTDMVTEQVV